jgi:DNA-binding SARP family transcriptional activator/Tfp pilus assembly protein PilF
MLLRLQLFGAPRADVGGRPVEVDTRKAIALLVYLAVSGQEHRRDALAALLWPDYDHERARAALRRTLSTLNRAVASSALSISRSSVAVDPLGTRVDVHEFHALLDSCARHGHPPSETCPQCIAPLTRAADLYRGDFLAGFGLRDAPSFDEWQLFQTESLRREVAAVLERVVGALAEDGHLEAAISFARRWLALDPLHEPAHRRLMALHAARGSRSEALRQYRECVSVLERELGVAPLEETTALYAAIRDGSAIAAAAPARSDPTLRGRPPRGDKVELPLVGRSAELATLLRAYEDASAHGHFVAVEGEAGVGKTRLVRELIAEVAGRGAPVLEVASYPGEEDVAYGVVIRALRALLTSGGEAGALDEVPDRWLRESARLVPELESRRPHLAPAEALESPAARSHFLEGVAQTLLVATAGDAPAVWFCDDLQWADDPSLGLLAHVLRLGAAPPLLVVGAWRGADLSSGSKLRTLLWERRRARRATSVELARLSRSDVTELVTTARALDPRSGADLGARLYEETEGLAFFVAEYMAALGGAHHERGSLPGGVRDLLASQVGSLTETARQAASAAAAVGRSFGLDVLREASGRSEEEVVAALEELMGRGLVRESGPSGDFGAIQYDFAHEKMRAFVYESCSLARRRLLHRRVARALQRRGRRDRSGALLATVAEHHRLAGNDRQAAEYRRAAGESARALFANREAMEHFRAALALGHPDAAALHEAIGDLETLDGSYPSAVLSYETAAALARPDHLPALEHKLGGVRARAGEWAAADSHLRAALAGLELDGRLSGAARERPPGGERARVCADLSLVAHHSGRSDEALELGHRALELARDTGDDRASAQAHNILGILAKASGELAEARSHLEASLERADALGEQGARAAALNNLALVARERGELEHALDLTERALALCSSQGDRHREAALHNNLADLLHALGRGDAAMAQLKAAARLFADIGEQATMQPEIWKLVEW